VNELRGRLLVDGALHAGVVRWEGERITAVELDASVPRGASIVAPGFCDLHVHGFGGCEPLTDLAGMAAALARHGTTAFQPTLFPCEPERLGGEAAAVWESARALPAGGATPVGLHLEGPFVNPRKAGALPVADLAAPSVAGLRAIVGPATGDGRGIRTLTIAPELAGSTELIEELARLGIRASLGHSLASAREARMAARAGAIGLTHLYNAMSGLHHRDAGLASFGLTVDGVHCELIGDLVHAGAEAVELALRARGPAGLCLVSDALPGAGTGCDVFDVHGREHHVRDGAAWLATADGTPTLGGAVLSQLEMVRTLVDRRVCSPADALTMASETPARALGLEDRGRLEVGARADLVVLGPGLELERVRVGGVPVGVG